MQNAKKCALTIKANSGHVPSIREMSDGYAWLYLDRSQDTIDKYSDFFTLSGDNYEDIVAAFMKSEPHYSSYKDFLIECGFSENEIENERITE